MQKLIDFFSFSDPNIRYVVFGSVILAASAAIVGTFTFLKKRALVGDAVAHSVLPGICVGFLLSGTKNPFFIIIGAFSTGWLSIVLIDFITAKTKIKTDTAIALILSVFFGIGILLLTAIQHSGNASQAGLDHFLFGKAASLVGEDLILFSILGILLILTILSLYKELKILCFDPHFASVIGLPVRRLELVLTTLTVLAVVVGIQAVGVVLMAALLITPAAAARFWTNKLHLMIILAASFGAVSAVAGAFVSFLAPAMPTGPWIVLFISFIAIFSFFTAPGKGILSKQIKSIKNRNKILEDNILKLYFQMGEADKSYFTPRSQEALLRTRSMSVKLLNKGLKRLINQGLLIKQPEGWQLTGEGKTRGQRVAKLHRLWEVYLSEYLKIAPDHVHDDAETIEHIISPEIESRLEQLLNFPAKDPHAKRIPY